MLLDKLPTKIIGFHGTPKRPLDVWAIAFGRDYRHITEPQHQRFRHLVGQYARQPLHWKNELRYRIGRLICGRGPFAPYLDAECFDTELVRAA
jgi:hypothetical protein